MKRIIWISALVVGVAAVGFVAGHATADTPPKPAPLVFYGQLEESGALVDADRVIAVTFWKSASAADAGSKICETRPVGKITVKQGRFELALDATCAEAVRTTTEAWAQVEVAGEPLGRTRIGAVPYAIRAESVTSVPWPNVTGVSASTAWPGTIDAARVANAPDFESRIAALEARVAPVGKPAVIGSYCGSTAASSGDAGGYTGVAAKCATVCGAGARVCTGHELVSYQSANPAGLEGWFATAAAVFTDSAFDCVGFKSAAAAQRGAYWRDGTSAVSDCNYSRPILCCR